MLEGLVAMSAKEIDRLGIITRVLAEIAQAERLTALADAYVEEASLFVSGPETDR